MLPRKPFPSFTKMRSPAFTEQVCRRREEEEGYLVISRYRATIEALVQCISDKESMQIVQNIH